MAVVNSIAAMQEELTAWRRDLHAHPELQYEVHRTAGIVAEKLKAFGCDDVVAGIGRTGVVGVIKGRKGTSGRVIGLRADMDALPLTEITGLAHASKAPGKMHACGHDGHTTMLLGAARYLAETRNFDGTAIVIFQPAEEGGAGGKAMVDDGMMERFGIQEVYGLHNQPGMPVGSFALRPGPFLASGDTVTIKINGKGGHAAKPHQCIDPIMIGAHIVTQLQSVVARSINPLESGVVSVTMFNGGSARNIIPETAELVASVRSLTPEVRALLERRICEIAEGTARLHGATAAIDYSRGYPVTCNHERETTVAARAAADVSGATSVATNAPPVMGSEDFSYMLEARPGAFIFMGNGDTAGLHHPAYDFNDAAIPVGASFWARLVETSMPA